MNPKIKTEMTGKEYLEYLKYKDAKSKAASESLTKHLNKYGWRYVISGGFFILLIAIIETLTYTEPVRYTFDEYMQFSFIFLLIAIGISWIIHGVGFVIIKR